MPRIFKPFLLFFLIGSLLSCNSIPDKPWTEAVPEKNPFVIIPAENATLNSILDSPYIPFLDDITASAISMVAQIDTTNSSSLPINGIMLYPGARNQLHPIWVTTAPENYDEKLEEVFREPFAQNQYYFNDITIRKLHIQDRNIFAAQLNQILLLSESSQGIEDVIRAYLDIKPAADFSKLQLNPSSIVLNTPSLDNWVEQLGKIIYRPVIKNGFTGTKPVELEISNTETEEYMAQSHRGTLRLNEETAKSSLVAAISDANAPIELDQYISSDAAAFGIFRLAPRLAPPLSTPDSTASPVDSLLIEDKVTYASLAKSLDAPFALVMYAESGFLTTGEHLFLRKVADRSVLQQELDELESKNLVDYTNGIYYIQSKVLAEMIGSELNTFSNFYLDITGDAVVISKRRGLAEKIASDRNRRRVIYYENQYADIKETLPSEVSSLVMTSNNFRSFIQPFLAPENYMDVLLSEFDMMALSTRLGSSGEELALDITTYQTQQDDQPYEENWLFPLGNPQLTGKPVLADIGGSSREEIIFATESNTVYGLAADGTQVLEVSTESDTPVGSPAVYDWYGTGQNVILIAAGDKIYGWNDTGEMLPNFPFELPENITSPILIRDINRNGLPNVLVATADRQVHVLDGRGENISRWPQTTNAPITTTPLVDNLQGSYSIIAFAENAIHAWNTDGSTKNNFPQFLEASLSGSPVIYRGNILAGGADGYLYSVGQNELFADSLNTLSNTTDTSGVERVYVANSALKGTSSIHNNLTVESEENGDFSGTMILTMSSNGSIFFIDEEGALRFTKSMGQPGSDTFSPTVVDLDSNGEVDLVSLANFGRFYAWQISDGRRLLSLPTTAMEYPVVANINNNNYREIIAQTQQGLRSWTIYNMPELQEETEEEEEEGNTDD